MMHRILVVEKDKNLCFLYKLVLSKEGYDVITVSSREEALDKLREMDLVISELESPINNDCHRFNFYYKSNEKIKLIVNTGYPLDSVLEFDCRVDAVLPKSSDFAELKHTIRNILQTSN
jgi:DNA-binding response OmpR family regulator